MAPICRPICRSIIEPVARADGGVRVMGGSGPTPPAGAIRDRSGAYILDRAGNYIKVR